MKHFFVFTLCLRPLFAAPAFLSQTGLYSDLPRKILSAEVASYIPRFPLWSDGIEKQRWIRLPAGTQVDKSDPNAWVIPIGTQLFKEFDWHGQRVETRLIQKKGESQWEFVSYVWNGDETEAKLAPSTGIQSHLPLTDTIFHDIPSQGQCRFCHQRFGDPVLGYSQIQLGSEPIPGHSSLERAALGYLHGNCGSCHHPEGRAGFTENFYHLTVEASTAEQTPAYTTSVNLKTVNFPIPGLETTYRLLPGHPEQSALIYRLTLEGPQHMPSLGSKIPDATQINLLRQWVAEMH